MPAASRSFGSCSPIPSMARARDFAFDDGHISAECSARMAYFGIVASRGYQMDASHPRATGIHLVERKASHPPTDDAPSGAPKTPMRHLTFVQLRDRVSDLGTSQ